MTVRRRMRLNGSSAACAKAARLVSQIMMSKRQHRCPLHMIFCDAMRTGCDVQLGWHSYKETQWPETADQRPILELLFCI